MRLFAWMGSRFLTVMCGGSVISTVPGVFVRVVMLATDSGVFDDSYYMVQLHTTSEGSLEWLLLC